LGGKEHDFSIETANRSSDNVCKKNIVKDYVLTDSSGRTIGNCFNIKSHKKNLPTTFAQPMTTATNNTQGMLTKFPFKPGIFVTPLSRRPISFRNHA
jgi:hypothetical protein